MGTTICGFGRATAVTLGNFSFPVSALSSSDGSVEANKSVTMRFSGLVDRLGVNFDANGTGRSVQLRQNSANAGNVAAPPDSTAGAVYDTTHQDRYAIGDTIDFQLNGAGTAFIPLVGKFTFTADNGHVQILGFGGVIPGAQIFLPIQAATSQASSIVAASVVMRSRGTWQNMAMTISTATTSVLTMISLKNGIAGNQTVTSTASTTGAFEDTTHTDSFISGDALCYEQTGGASAGVITATAFFAYDTFNLSEMISGTSASFSFSASDQFYAFTGSPGISTTESTQKIQHGFNVTTSNFRMRVSANTYTAATTHKVRKNGADGNQTISVPASTVGFFEDSTHTDVFGPTDDICYVVRGGTSGSMAFGWVAITESVGMLQPGTPTIFM